MTDAELFKQQRDKWGYRWQKEYDFLKELYCLNENMPKPLPERLDELNLMLTLLRRP